MDLAAPSASSLADVILSKEVAGREKDRAVLPILGQVLKRSRKKERDIRELEPRPSDVLTVAVDSPP